MKKRFLSFILILSMFITVLPTQVMAKEENDVDMDTSYSNVTANSALPVMLLLLYFKLQ